jgi:hypothetical protein
MCGLSKRQGRCVHYIGKDGIPTHNILETEIHHSKMPLPSYFVSLYLCGSEICRENCDFVGAAVGHAVFGLNLGYEQN